MGKPNSDGEVRGYCPICEEPGESKTPSASFNFSEGLFTCFSQCGGMSIRSLVNMMRQGGDFDRVEKKEQANLTWLHGKKKPSEQPSKEILSKLPSEDRIEDFVDRLLATSSRLRVMREKRGLRKETLERFQIGWDGERYTIPVRDREGQLVNVRRYNPHAKEGKDKMKSWTTGTGQRRLFLLDALDEETVIITEGEMDALIGRQYDLPTLSHTAGASAWDNRWNELFEGKVVYIVYDCDDAGRRGARRVARALELFARQVNIIDLPLRGKGDDLTNYFVDQGYTATDFYTLMQHSAEQANQTERLRKVIGGEPTKVSLQQTMSSETHERLLAFEATVAGKVNPVFIAPKNVEFDCNEGGGNRCARCPISGRNHKEIVVNKFDPVVTQVIGKSQEARNKTLLRYVNIPPTCPDVEISEREVFSVEELIVVPPPDAQYGSVIQVDRKIFNVGPYDTPVNTKMSFLGMNVTSDKDGRAQLQAWDSERSDTDIDKFKINDTNYEKLSAFWPREGQSIIGKLCEISDDIAANVTKIYDRRALHMAYDLVWHSALNFQFKGQDVGKGWLELLVIGDTRTGKSEAAQHLCHHYRSGVLTTCEGATFAGLVGGVQQMSGTWVVSWGTIPLNDRRLVVLDEFGGLAEKGILEQMSSVRSSGIAQINKIQQSQTMARTRLIWIANPIDGSTISGHTNGGMDAIKGLAKNPEDIARFDLAMAVSSEEVDIAQINIRRPKRIPHRFTSKLCSTLISWVWSRTAEQIVWEKGVENYVLERAQILGARYVPDPPLVQAENIRIKLARLAVAIAGRLFSTDETGELLVVNFEHVEAAERLLNGFYGAESFGYSEYSANVIHERQLAQKNAKAVRQYLAANEDVLEVLKQCISGPFKVRDFVEFGGMSMLEAQEVVRTLQTWRVIRRLSKGYIRAEPVLTDMVKKLDRQRT